MSDNKKYKNFKDQNEQPKVGQIIGYCILTVLLVILLVLLFLRQYENSRPIHVEDEVTTYEDTILIM